jgi:hypothetical protein
VCDECVEITLVLLSMTVYIQVDREIEREKKKEQ